VCANKLKNQAIELVTTGLVMDYPEAFVGCSTMDAVDKTMMHHLTDKVLVAVKHVDFRWDSNFNSDPIQHSIRVANHA
jgi:ribosome-associated toxin RatA of RatAB toxin-antitoxin module